MQKVAFIYGDISINNVSDKKWKILKPIKGFPCGSAGKESTCNAGDLGSIPGLERSPGEGKGYPLQYSGLENPMDCIEDRIFSWKDESESSLSYLYC